MLKADIISHRNIDSALENSYVIFHIQDIIDLFLYMNFLWGKKKKGNGYKDLSITFQARNRMVTFILM